MTVKKCDLSDLKRVANFYDNVMLYLINNVNYPKWTYGVYPCENSVKQAILQNEQYLTENNGEVVGAFILNNNPQGSYYKGNWQKNLNEGEYLVIHTLATLPNFYNKGVAKHMVEYCLNLAKNNGYKSVRLDIVPQNIPAKKLYEKLGFTFAGEFDLDRGFEDIPTFLLYEYNF